MVIILNTIIIYFALNIASFDKEYASTCFDNACERINCEIKRYKDEKLTEQRDRNL